MAIGTPTGLGTAVALNDATPAITTSGVVPSGALVIVTFGWGSIGAANTLNSVAGGSLSWAIDHAQAFAGAIPWGYAIASAQAPSGLASATTITGTLSGSFPYATLIAAMYCTGLASSTPKDISDGNGASATAWDTTATTTTVADTLVIGGCLHDGTTTNTATGGATELYDFQEDTTNAWTACVEYKILSATASTSLTGTWAAGANNYVAAFVAYKMTTGAAEAPTMLSMAPYQGAF